MSSNQITMPGLFDKQLILVVAKYGNVSVEADIYGQYAVHKALTKSGESKDWTVTHAMSGLYVVQRIIEYDIASGLAVALDGAHIDADGYWNAGQCAPKEFYEHLNSVIKAWEKRYQGRLGGILTGCVVETESGAK